MKDDALILAGNPAHDSPAVELGVWLGRHQALASLASRCSAADLQALRTIREQKLYREWDLTWQEFCKLHAGCSYKTADRMIERFEEFGETYFNLSQIVDVPPSEYRDLQPAIEENTLAIDGRRIPIDPQNAPQLIEAVQTLRARLRKGRPEAKRPASLESRIDQWFGELEEAAHRARHAESVRVRSLIMDFVRRLQKLDRQL
jgi:hypothetical protein